jgi:hypothetical protein
MATTLEIIRGLAQAAANTYDGALDDKGEPVKIGLKREEGHPIHDKRVIDGFSVSFAGPELCIKYHSQIDIKKVNGGKLESEIEQMIADVAAFLKKEYKRITGKSVSLTRSSDVNAHMEYMNRVRCWVTASQNFTIGGLGGVTNLEESEKRLDASIRSFLKR